MKKEKIIEVENTNENIEAPAMDIEAKKGISSKVTKVGAMLKEMRMQKGLKIVDISKKLCIRKCYLEAIEDSNYKEIPAFPYGIGFIRSYAKFLGLNGENIVELYKEETSGSSDKDIHILEPQPEATVPGIQYLLISLFFIVVIYVGWTFFNQPPQEETLSSIEQASTDASADNDAVIIVEEFNSNNDDLNVFNGEETTDASATSSDNKQITVSNDVYVENKINEEPTLIETPSEPQQVAENNIPNEGIFIEVVKETWIEVKDDNKLYISKVLQVGDTYKVPEGKGKILTVGKYDGVNVYVNGVLTDVVRPNKKRNIALDSYLNTNY